MRAYADKISESEIRSELTRLRLKLRAGEATAQEANDYHELRRMLKIIESAKIGEQIW